MIERANLLLGFCLGPDCFPRAVSRSCRLYTLFFCLFVLYVSLLSHRILTGSITFCFMKGSILKNLQNEL